MANKIENLTCVCGSQTVCQALIEVDGLKVNQLYCPNCGIIMRSPSTDTDGKWLHKHWEAIIMRGTSDQVHNLTLYLKEAFELCPDDLEVLNDWHPGLPGYAPNISNN